MSQLKEGVLLIFQAIEDLKRLAEEPDEEYTPQESIRQMVHDDISRALGKLQLFKEDRMRIMDILDKVRRGEDATPPDDVSSASDLIPLARGAIATIFHNGTKQYYEAVILGEAEKS